MDIEKNKNNRDNSIEDRHINISQFLEARSSEIGHFTSQVIFKKNGSNKIRICLILESFQKENVQHQNFIHYFKLAYQMVKKHLRRRAMSHNRYRIPRRIRNRMNVQELDVIEKTQDPIRCRKHLRKPKLLMNSYIRRSRSDKWMETHLWHAKRMRMIKYFQYKIARTPNEKGDRACYRFANHECTVYDRSYYEFIFIQGSKLHDFISNHITQKDQKQIIQNQKKNYKITDQIDVFKNDLTTLIGPAQFIWKCENELVVFIHPGCVFEWEQILSIYVKNQENIINDTQPLTWLHIKDNYNVFDLAGPQSLYKVHYLLANLGLSEDEIKSIHPLVSNFSIMNDAANYPKNQVIQLNFKSQVSQKLVKPPFNFSQVCVNDNPLNQDILNKCLIDIVKYNQQVKIEQNSLLDSIKIVKLSEYITRFKTITRNRYTHKKKDKIGKKQKLNALSQAKIDEKQKQEEIIQQYSSKQQEARVSIAQSDNANSTSEVKQAKDLVESEINLMIIFRNSKQHESFGQGVTLVVNQGRGILVWRLLSFIACKAIGLNEFNNIVEESGYKVFPNDYPLTDSYKTLNKQILEDKVTKHFLKPKGKRVNYLRINSPFPLKPNFDYILSQYLESEEKIVAQHEDLQDVRVIAVGRGRPVVNSYICLPEPQDFKKYADLVQQDKSRVYCIHEEPTNVIPKSNTIDLPEPSQIKTSRQIIGFLSFGDFSFKTGVGKGRGQIIKYYLDNLKSSQPYQMDEENKQKIDKSNEFLCLIRNPTSRNYYMANLYQN